MNNARKLLVYSAGAASIGYFFSIASGSIGLFLFIALWLFNFQELNFKNLLKWNNLYWLILFFIILIIEISYSSDFKQGQKYIMRHLPFLVLPIIFTTIKPFDKKERLLIIKIFIHSLTIFFTICLITAIVRQIGFWGRGGIFNWYYFYRYDFLEVFNQHPTYLSMFTLLSISFLLLLKKQLKLPPTFLYIILFIQMIAIIFFGSRIGYIIFFIIMFFYFFKNVSIRDGSKKIRYIIFYSICGLVISLIAFNIPIVKERILYTLGYKYEYKFNNIEFIKSNTPEEQGRLLLWQDAIDLIKERPVLGYGTGSTNKILLKKYEEEGHALFLEKRYNTHNSYLELLLSGGVILLLSYLILLFILFINSIWLKKWILWNFTLIIAITSITETIFIAQGLIFFSFFYCFSLSRINQKSLVIIGPYPPPIGGISLFMQKFKLYFNSNFEEKISIVNEFGSNEDKKVYNLHSKSKFLYFLRLIKYIVLNNNFSHLYYNGTHGYTRFLLIVFAKILDYKVIFHFHGKSALNFYNDNWLNKILMQFTLSNAYCLIAVNKNIVTELKEINHKLCILEIPAYLNVNNAEPSKAIDNFLHSLLSDNKYYVSYGTLDRSKESKYNYGFEDLIKVFSSENIRAKKIGLILILVLHKKEHFSEYDKTLKPLIEKSEANISVFINKGNEPLTPFFKSVEGYIRYTYEDGLGVSLFEALNSGIKAIATNVCNRPEGVMLFDPKNHSDLEKLILMDSINQTPIKKDDFDKEYKKLFIKLGFTLKKKIIS